MALHETIPLLPFFSLTYVRNTGAAFGVLGAAPAGGPPAALPRRHGRGGVGARLVAPATRGRGSACSWPRSAAILGGAAGNLICRVRYGEVIDFLDLHWGDLALAGVQRRRLGDHGRRRARARPRPDRARMSRQIVLEGCLNFRDLGGLPTADGRRVREGRLFRSDALHKLTATDVVVLRDRLAISTVLDLRSTFELEAEGHGPLAAEQIAMHHVPLFDGDLRGAKASASALTLADRYLILAEMAREPIARVVALIADAPGPALFHCAAGKDRTGVISAVLLGLLGVADEVIVADYVTSRENIDAITERLRSTAGYRKMLDALPPDTMHAEPETMQRFLAGIAQNHGSMAAYARAAGLDDDVLARLTAPLRTQRGWLPQRPVGDDVGDALLAGQSLRQGQARRLPGRVVDRAGAGGDEEHQVGGCRRRSGSRAPRPPGPPPRPNR